MQILLKFALRPSKVEKIRTIVQKGERMAVDARDRRAIDARDIGSAIRERRRKLKLSQIELSDLSGVSVRAVGHVEAGKATARLDTVLPLLDVLGLDLSITIRRSA